VISLGELTGQGQRRRGHDGKMLFASEGAALAAIRSLVRRGLRPTGQVLIDGDTLRPYPCRIDFDQHGDHWHIGHSRRC